MVHGSDWIDPELDQNRISILYNPKTKLNMYISCVLIQFDFDRFSVQFVFQDVI